MGDQARGQPHQLPTQSGLLPAIARGGLRPITPNINPSAMMPRQQLMSPPLYLIPRANSNQVQAAPQPSFVHVRSLAPGQPNGIAGVIPQIRPFPPTTNSQVGGGSTLGKFLREVIELYQRKVATGAESPVTRLIQKLIDDEVDCDSFCSQLCDITRSGHKRTNVEILVQNNIAQLRRDLAIGVFVLPHIVPPVNRPQPVPLAPSRIPQTTVLVNAGTILNTHPTSATVTSQILPRPSDGLPANATFQLSQTSLPVTTMPRPIPQQLNRALLKPTTQPFPNRMKAPISPATTTITPQRGSLFAGAAGVRPIYPASVAAIASAPAPSPVSVTSSTNLMNIPFFPVSQIRSHLSTQLSSESNAMLSDEAVNCLAHGLETLLRSILTRVSVVVGHKTVKLANDPHLKQLDHAKEQLNYIQRLDEHNKRKQSELEKEYILKAAKSRTRNENPDQVRFREIANQLKNEDYERERQRQADSTALKAIGTPANRRSRTSFNPVTSTAVASADLHAGGVFPSGGGVIDCPSTPRLSLINSATASGSASSRLRLVQPSSSNTSLSASPLTSFTGVTGVTNATSSTTSVAGVASLSVPAPSTSRFNLAASLRTRRATLRELQVSPASNLPLSALPNTHPPQDRKSRL